MLQYCYMTYCVLLASKSFFFITQVATRTLSFYQKYFDVPYGLPKMDLIGIADFGIGMYSNFFKNPFCFLFVKQQ